jgi:hypothetical protein
MDQGVEPADKFSVTGRPAAAHSSAFARAFQ